MVFRTFRNISSFRKKFPLRSMCYLNHIYVSHTSYIKNEHIHLKVGRRVFLPRWQPFE